MSTASSVSWLGVAGVIASCGLWASVADAQPFVECTSVEPTAEVPTRGFGPPGATGTRTDNLDLSGNTFVVGAPGDDVFGFNSGSAFLYELDTGLLLSKLLPSDGDRRDFRGNFFAVNTSFGDAVAVEGDYVVVGRPGDVTVIGASGSIYVYDANTGAELRKIAPSDSPCRLRFGKSIDLSGTTAIVGSTDAQVCPENPTGIAFGQAYLFDVSNGAELGTLFATDRTSFDFFGSSVAIDGDRAIVGAPGNNFAAYIFDVGNGAQLHKLIADDRESDDGFGHSVDISGNYAIVGAPSDDNENGLIAGAAYIYDVTTGAELRKLIASDGAQQDLFGQQVTIDGNLAIVGSASVRSPPRNPIVYLFDVRTGEELGKIEGFRWHAMDGFGLIANDTEAPGWRFSRLSVAGGVGDYNGDLVTDFLDVANFLNDVMPMGLTADDLSDLLEAVADSCD